MDKEASFLWPLFLQFFLIFVNAVFTSAEISLLSVNRTKLEGLSAQGNKKAKRLLSLTGEPAKFLATIQVGITLAGFLGSAFAADNFSGRLTVFLVSLWPKIPYATMSTISLVTIILILSFFSLVLGELVPKRIAMKKADAMAFAYAGFIIFVSRIFAPVVWLLTGSTNALLRFFKMDPKAADSAITEEEIRLMIDMGSAGGAIKSGEKEILHNIFEFDNKTAGEVMTHRRNADILYLAASDDEWEKTITEKRRNNFPVCGEDFDDILGILNTRDYLVLKDRRRENALERALRPARFVPLSVRTDILFRQMKISHNHFAVVIDEYGSMMGIVTMNDLLEELVGDLEDDSSAPPEKPPIEKSGENTWYINGTVPLEKIAREFSVKLPLEKYDTFAGYVFSLLGHIPEDGGTAELETPDFIIKLLEVKERRLEKAMLTKIDKS